MTEEAHRRLAEHVQRFPEMEHLILWAFEDAPAALQAQEPFPDKVLRFFLANDPSEDWWVSGTVYLLDGRIIIGRLTIEPNTFPPRDRPPDGGIGSRLLRGLSLTQLTNRIIATIRAEPETARLLQEAFPEFVGSPVMPVAHDDQGAEAPRRGRPPKDEFYEQIAREYLVLQAEGIDRGIIIEIARRHGDVPRETARDWVRRARHHGFLRPGSPGKAGADPGPRLLALMHDETPEPKKATRRPKRKT